MFFGKSEKDSLWSQVVPTKMFLKKKTFKLFHNAFATKQWQKRCSVVLLFWLHKEHWDGQIYQMNRAFHLNKAHCLKSYIGSSVYKDDKLQCMEEYKYTSNQVRSR